MSLSVCFSPVRMVRIKSHMLSPVKISLVADTALNHHSLTHSCCPLRALLPVVCKVSFARLPVTVANGIPCMTRYISGHPGVAHLLFKKGSVIEDKGKHPWVGVQVLRLG